MDFRKTITILLWTLPTTWLGAETIFLKTGEKIEARVTHSSDTEIEIEVPVSASISDVRVIARKDIDHIEQPDASLPVFASLQKLAVLPNSLSSQEYDALIKGQLIPFLAKYPNSTRLGEMQNLIATLSDEKKRVIQGETKIENEWFDSHELVAEKEQIAATLAYQQIEATASNGPVEALNQFARFEKKYPGAKTFPAAIEAAQARIGQLRQIVVSNLQTLPERLAAREAGWKLTAEPQKSQLIAAAKADDKAIQDTLAAARKAGDTWVPLAIGNKESLETLLKTADTEGKRLAALPLDKMRASIAASVAGRQQVAAGQFDEAATSFQRATTLWPMSIMNRRNPLLLAEARAAAAATPTPTPSPTPSLDWLTH